MSKLQESGYRACRPHARQTRDAQFHTWGRGKGDEAVHETHATGMLAGTATKSNSFWPRPVVNRGRFSVTVVRRLLKKHLAFAERGRKCRASVEPCSIMSREVEQLGEGPAGPSARLPNLQELSRLLPVRLEPLQHMRHLGDHVTRPRRHVVRRTGNAYQGSIHLA